VVMNEPCWSRASLTVQKVSRKKVSQESFRRGAEGTKAQNLGQGDSFGDARVGPLADNTLEEAVGRPAQERELR